MDYRSLHISQDRLHPLLLGVGLGLLVIIDPWATRFLELDYPYLFTAILLFVVGTATIVYSVQNHLYLNRYQIALIFMVIGLQTTAIQAGLDIGEIIIAMLLPLVFFNICSGSDNKFLITPLNFMVVLFFIIIVASLAKDFNPLAIRKELKAVVVFFLMLNLLHWSRLNTSTVRWFIIVTTCSAVFALMQESLFFATGDVIAGNIDKTSLKRMFEETALGPLFRVPGLTNGYREFGLILSLSISLLASRLLYLRDSRKTIWVLALAINLAAVSCTYAKDILLGLFMGLTILLFIYRPRLLWPAGLLTVLSAALLVIFLSMTPGGWETTSETIQAIPGVERERMQLNREGLEYLFASGNYLLGAGVNAQAACTDHFQGWKAHNAFILITDASGLLGLFAYSAIFAWILYRLISINLLARTDEHRALARGLLMFYLVTLIALQFTSQYIEIVFWFYAALVETSTTQIIGRGTLATSTLPSCEARLA